MVASSSFTLESIFLLFLCIICDVVHARTTLAELSATGEQRPFGTLRVPNTSGPTISRVATSVRKCALLFRLSLFLRLHARPLRGTLEG